MNRREILKYTAWATGAAVGAPLISAVLSGCESEPAVAEGADLQLFSTDDFALLQDLVDVILPATDSPSASEVGVPHTIDHMVGYVYDDPARQSFAEGFAALAGYLRQAGFEKSDGSGKLEMLKALQISTDEGSEPVRKAFLDLRQQTIAYYLSTEEIGTKFLNYLPVPGTYAACISLEEAGGKASAL